MAHTPESRWDELTDIFEALLESQQPHSILDGITDPDLKAEALRLWSHHELAGGESFLGSSIGFQARPVFEAGQLVAGRFLVKRPLGQGGMGEVYLAEDQKLGGEVALKTIARLLATSPPIRERFLAEVRNAKRVTHPNICRIHDLFEEGQSVFFSMEYLNGKTLDELLQDSSLTPAQVRPLLYQLAMGLDHAHHSGVIHGDFKPGNVFICDGPAQRAVITDFGLARAIGGDAPVSSDAASLRMGTEEYLAPELSKGGKPSVPADIYAFAILGKKLLPGLPAWEDALAEDPARRPKSLERIARDLAPGQDRRSWMLAAVAGLSAVAAAGIWRKNSSGIILAPGTRLLVDRFRSPGTLQDKALFLRSAFLKALDLSPRLRPVTDSNVLTVLPEDPTAIPSTQYAQILGEISLRENAEYWLEGAVDEAEGRFTLNLTLVRARDNSPVLRKSFADQPGPVAAAESAASWLRKETGESVQSYAKNSQSLNTFTTNVPEALELYFEAMAHYAAVRTGMAIPLLERALQLDPNFAQAHNILGMSLNAQRRFEESFPHLVRAMQLSGNLPAAEKSWIETNYYTLLLDPDQMVNSAERKASFDPADPRGHRILAFNLCRVGRSSDAIPEMRRAIELSPSNILHHDDFACILCEAGKFEEALEVSDSALKRFAAKEGPQKTNLYWGNSIALMGLEKFALAAERLHLLPGASPSALAGARMMAGEFNLAEAILQADRPAGNIAEAFMRLDGQCWLHYLRNEPGRAAALLESMETLPLVPVFAMRHLEVASWAYRLNLPSVLERTRHAVESIRQKFPHRLTQSYLTHAQALDAAISGKTQRAMDLLAQSMDMAFNPLALFDLAILQQNEKQFEAAESTWSKLLDRRGHFYRYWCPSLIGVVWLYQAQCLKKLGRSSEAEVLCDKVLGAWGKAIPNSWTVQTARTLYSDKKLERG